MSFTSIDPQDVSTRDLHGYLLGTIAPRPIAFASTIDSEGNVNLSPYSYFNVFGTNPPTLIFSPSRRVRDNTNKHTLENIQETKETVINIVNFPIVEQMSLASSEYPKGTNEFIKAGFTEESSIKVKPPRVKESPAAFECIVKDVIETGQGKGAGNLVICEVVMMHIRENVLDSNGKIDPFKFDAVARMGGNWYCHANGDSLFEIPKPSKQGIGVDQIPESIKNSHILTGNNLGRLGNIETLPTKEAIQTHQETTEIQAIFEHFSEDEKNLTLNLHQLAKKQLEEGKLEEAWMTLLQKV